MFFGEYLHALADTYGHADPENDPYHGTQLGLGVGHGWNDSDPDYTFDHYGFPALINKLYPEAQPGPAQRSIFDAIVGNFKSDSPDRRGFDSLTKVLQEFNRIGESEEYTFNLEGKDGKYRSPRPARIMIVRHQSIKTLLES